MRTHSLKNLVLVFFLLAFSLSAAPPTRRSVLSDLNSIVIKEIELNDLTIEEVIRVLQTKSTNKINFLYLPHTKPKPPTPQVTNNIPFGFDPATGLPQAPLPPPVFLAPPIADNVPRIINGNIILRNITLKQVLDISTLCFNQPMQYIVTDFGVVFIHPKDDEKGLFTRVFRVNPRVFRK